MYKKISTLLNLAACIIIILLLVNMCSLSNQLDDSRSNTILNDEELQKELSRYRDTLGRERVQYKIKQITIDQLQMSVSKDLKAIKEELELQGLKLKNSHSTTIVQTTTTDTLQIVSLDTIPCNTAVGDRYASDFIFKDSFIDVKGITNFSFTGESWALEGHEIRYSLKNKMSINYTFSNKFFTPRELFLTVMNDNPNTRVGKVQTYTIKYRKKWYEHWVLHQLVGATWGAAAMYGIKK